MSATLENRFYDLYLEYFQKAETHRRWNVWEDIPWEKANKDINPEIAQVMESYFAVEMYLPDYTANILKLIRQSRGRAWFQANWGYEESKHSLALDMWLTRSGSRTEQQMRNYADELLQREWTLPYDSPLEMLVYTVFQEFATGVNYRNLRKHAQDSNDPALDKVLALLARDETGHFEFFKNGVQIFMEQDRCQVLEAINHVIKTFSMPAQNIIPDWEPRDQLIRQLNIFDDRIYHREVVKPVIKALGVTREEMRESRRQQNENPELLSS